MKVTVRVLTWICRSSRPEVFCKKGVLRNSTKFTGKHLCQSLFLIKLQVSEHLYISMKCTCSNQKMKKIFFLFGNELCFNEGNKAIEEEPTDGVTNRIGNLEERDFDCVYCCEISFHNTKIFQCSFLKPICKLTNFLPYFYWKMSLIKNSTDVCRSRLTLSNYITDVF